MKKSVMLVAALVTGALVYHRFHTEEAPDSVLDATGIPTHACPICGERQFKVLVSFEDYEIVTYSIDGYCATCGTYCSMPTPLDREMAP